jgi:PAT family beta-lactamase induction signal transducer AmpG
VFRGVRFDRLGILWTLYFVQGLPFGFQATALPVYLRSSGMSLEGIGLATALALPWSLKPLWAPLVDRYGSARFGRRKSWILPLQALLAVTCFAAAHLSPTEGLAPLLWLVLTMNLLAATMDIAVDGFAVDVLSPRELGHGNVAQVVGYKAGMLTGGGLLVWASGTIGWSGLFVAMAGLVAMSLLVTLSWNENAVVARQAAVEPREPGEAAKRSKQSKRSEESERAERAEPAPLAPHRHMGEILNALRSALTSSGAGWLILFVGTYKLGESMADTMFKPFLVDAGYREAQIGLWVGTWGMLCSIAGSVGGGLLARRVPLLRLVGWCAVARALPVAGEWWLTQVEATPERVLAVTCFEHLFGGALTTAMFAYMMSRVDRRIGATHYTLLAAVEVWGKLPAAWLSGFIAARASYATLFAVATVLSVAFLALLAPLARSRERSRGPQGAVGDLEPRA